MCSFVTNLLLAPSQLIAHGASQCFALSQRTTLRSTMRNESVEMALTEDLTQNSTHSVSVHYMFLIAHAVVGAPRK